MHLSSIIFLILFWGIILVTMAISIPMVIRDDKHKAAKSNQSKHEDTK